MNTRRRPASTAETHSLTRATLKIIASANGCTDTPRPPLHQACDPRPDVWYWIDVERIGTLRQVIHWASHLSDKGWITATDWADLLRRIGTDA